jgi:hypothetical protein
MGWFETGHFEEPGWFAEGETTMTTIKETNGILTIRAKLKNPTSRLVTAQYWAEDGTALNGQDFVLEPGELTFESEETEKTFEVEIIDRQGEGEAERSFTIRAKANGALDPNKLEVTIQAVPFPQMILEPVT